MSLLRRAGGATDGGFGARRARQTDGLAEATGGHVHREDEGAIADEADDAHRRGREDDALEVVEVLTGRDGAYSATLVRALLAEEQESTRDAVPLNVVAGLTAGGDDEEADLVIRRVPLDDLVAGVRDGGASAVLAASIFHFGTYTIAEAKAHMAAAGIPVRLE